MTNEELTKVKAVLNCHMPSEQAEEIMNEIQLKLKARMDPSRPGWYPCRMGESYLVQKILHE